MKYLFILICTAFISCTSTHEEDGTKEKLQGLGQLPLDTFQFENNNDSALLNGQMDLLSKINDFKKVDFLNGEKKVFIIHKENEFGENSYSISSKNNYLEIQRGFFCFISIKDSLLNINNIYVGSDSLLIWKKFHNIKRDNKEAGTYIVNFKEQDALLYFRIKSGIIREIGFNGLCN